MSAPTYDLGKLHGGLRMQGHKAASTSQAILDIPVPKQLVMPITQHVGDPAQPLVAIGERVLKGQLIAAPEGTLGAPVHASSSGTVVAIEPWPVSRRNGEKAPCIIIGKSLYSRHRNLLMSNVPSNFSDLRLTFSVTTRLGQVTVF